MATGTVKTNVTDKMRVFMAGMEGAEVSSIFEMMGHKQKETGVLTTSKIKDDYYNITFVCFVSSIRLKYYHNKSQALIFVIDSCLKEGDFLWSLRALQKLLENEKFDERPRPLLIWLNNQDQDGAITVANFREIIPEVLKEQLRKRSYSVFSIKPVSLLKPETLRRGFSWLAFEHQRNVDTNKGHLSTKVFIITKVINKELQEVNCSNKTGLEKAHSFLRKFQEVNYSNKTGLEKAHSFSRNKEDKKEENKVRVFMAGMQDVGKSTILAKMTNEETKYWKDYSFVRLKVGKTNYEVFKVPGQEEERLLWKYKLEGFEMLIFVVDATVNVNSRYNYTLKELKSLLNSEELETVPLLVFYNKLDKDCFELEVFKEILAQKLKRELQNRPYYVQQCIATRDEGLWEGFKMLEELKKQQEGRGKVSRKDLQQPEERRKMSGKDLQQQEGRGKMSPKDLQQQEGRGKMSGKDLHQQEGRGKMSRKDLQQQEGRGK